MAELRRFVLIVGVARPFVFVAFLGRVFKIFLLFNYYCSSALLVLKLSNDEPSLAGDIDSSRAVMALWANRFCTSTAMRSEFVP